MKIPETSIIILTLNSENKIEKSLKAIFSQKYKDFEVIIIDSESHDNTLKIASKYPVRIVKIKAKEFGHGKTRNLGARLARGKYITFMTDDAVPKDSSWLSELIKPLKDKNVVGAYARQVPRENENLSDKFFYLSLYPNKPKVWNWNNFTQGDNLFSDVSSIVKKDIFLKSPFKKDIIVTEDYEWASRKLKEGYKIVYASKAEVIHSHSYTLGKLFKRNFDIGVSYKSIFLEKTKQKGFFKKGIKMVSEEIKFLAKNKKIYLIPYSLFKDAIKYLAVTLGKHSNLLPNFINKRLSNYPRYWK
jgi:rhamnosyltransferase